MSSMKMRTNREDGVTISTVQVTFLDWYGDYETAISIDGEPWRIAEGYEKAKDAIKGHKKYEKMTREELLNFDYIG